MKLKPYLHFDGRCDEAIEFYKEVLGAKVNHLMRFKDCPEPAAPGAGAAKADKVMHADVTIAGSTVLMSDGRCQGQSSFDGFSLTLSAASDAEATRLFTALADGGKVTMPLAKTFFSSNFGMLRDRFGLTWIVLVEH